MSRSTVVTGRNVSSRDALPAVAHMSWVNRPSGVLLATPMNQTAALRPRQPLARALLEPVVRPIDRLLARLPAPVEERIRQRLGLDLFIVVAVVVVFMRLFAVAPWTPS